ncbi:MAG TPA: excinuclease ABC subunit UvrC [Thermodesulfovibrionales bacterium]|nr:excinuclease ABC subunit UvrC [Thermodesulfovibrionales bacterium]
MEKIHNVPQNPGVYLLKDQKERVIYVGKAKKLKNRLKSYFHNIPNLDLRKQSMVRLVTDFSYIITKNELEALILEATLIKQYKPRFNVVLRDDKNYPYLKLTIKETWPKLEVVRKIVKDGSLYFGPYVPAQGMWDILAFTRRNFPVRICNYSLEKPMRPCIQYQIGRCPAPCAGKVSRNDYMKTVDELKLFLKGERGELLGKLEEKMATLSHNLKFEEAARIRDRIKNITRAWESQRVVAPELGDMDIIGYYSGSVDVVFNVFFIRNGILTGTKDFYVRDAGNSPTEEVFGSFIGLFYAKEVIPPREIIVGNRPNELRNLKTWLRKKRGKEVKITVPSEGKRQELLRMADENAEQLYKSRKSTAPDESLEAVRHRLKLPSSPHSIGAFDVSTIAGSESVGAFIYWSEGEFKKNLYRHLRIKGVSGIDDYSMMNETITRTLKNLEDRVPDLIVIDGGKGHLEIAKGVIRTAGIIRHNGNPPMLIAIAKDPDRAFTVSSDIINLEDRSRESLLLKKIRDEVHRFALSYHKKVRGTKLMESPLEKIYGIGRKRRLELLRLFGSIDAIRNAPVEEIAKLKGFNKAVAQNLLNELRRQ